MVHILFSGFFLYPATFLLGIATGGFAVWKAKVQALETKIAALFAEFKSGLKSIEQAVKKDV